MNNTQKNEVLVDMLVKATKRARKWKDMANRWRNDWESAASEARKYLRELNDLSTRHKSVLAGAEQVLNERDAANAKASAAENRTACVVTMASAELAKVINAFNVDLAFTLGLKDDQWGNVAAWLAAVIHNADAAIAKSAEVPTDEPIPPFPLAA